MNVTKNDSSSYSILSFFFFFSNGDYVAERHGFALRRQKMAAKKRPPLVMPTLSQIQIIYFVQSGNSASVLV